MLTLEQPSLLKQRVMQLSEAIKMKIRLLFLPLVLSVSTLSACGSGSSSQPKVADPKPNTQPLVRKSDGYNWQPCQLPADSAQGSECVFVEVPLDWQDDQGERIEIGVIRYKSNVDNPKGDIWMLDGGPSNWGQTFANNWALRLVRDRDVYIPTIRGAGASTPLTCSVELEQNPQVCYDDMLAQYGDNLRHFNTISAAADVGFLIDEMSNPDHDVVLYGVSFGGYLAQRYLQQFPDQVDAVVIDSPAHIDSQSQYQTVHGDSVGYLILDYCAQDTFCNEQLNGAPVEFFEQTYQGLESGSCPVFGDSAEQISLADLREVFYWLLGERRYVLLPAFIKMLNRCDVQDQEMLLAWAEDVEQVMEFEEYVGGVYADYTATDWRSITATNVLMALTMEMSDQFRPSLSESEFMDLQQDLRFANVSNEHYRYADLWTLGFPDVDNTPKSPKMPILILHTDTDEGTVLQEGKSVAQDYVGADQQLIVVPRVQHAVGLWAWHDCPKSIVTAFLNDHSLIPDSSCTSTMPEINFKLDDDWGRELSMDLFDTATLWRE